MKSAKLMRQLKRNKATVVFFSIIIIALLLLTQPNITESISDFISGGSQISDTSNSGATAPETTPSDEDEETTTDQTWHLVGETGKKQAFIESGDYTEWSISFGSLRLGSGGDRTFKIEVSRRWNFKDVFTCGASDLVWCLHDSDDWKIWGATDTSTILTWKTETVTSHVVYDGTPWRMFIGNNFPCAVDVWWEINIYEWT